MIADIEQQTFDYTALDSDTVARLKQNALETRNLLKRTSDDIIQIGKNLLEAKGKLPHGQFVPWAKKELGISQQTAWRFMQIAKGKPVKSLTVSDLVVLPPVEPKEDSGKVRIRTRENDEEKSKRVEDFFIDFPHLHALSNREIAKRCNVTEGLVRKIRRDLLPEPTPQPEPLADFEQDIAPTTIVESTIVQESVIEAPPLPIIEQEPTPAPLPKIAPSQEVQMEREIRRQQQLDRNEELREKGVELPSNKYACLIVDPPWEMGKIEREERPNQLEFDYPTMTEDELRAFPLPDLSGDDCHLYLWATQKYLPMALRLAEHWGFKYQCLMTWVKNVGFTPFSWMYSTEHVLFCTKGNLPLLSVGRRLDFSAKVREHSRKPDEFYDLIREVSPGPRIDVFSREKRDGFEQYGNEVEKFVSAR